MQLGLIGFPLGHSLSPPIHNAALRAAGLAGEYRLFPIPPLPEGAQALAGLVSRLRQGEFDGLNVTIPHKPNVLALVDEQTPAVETLGAANTLVRLTGGRLRAANTDVPGFLSDLYANAPHLRDQPGQALVLGAGGSARAVVYALAETGWRVTVSARRYEQARTLVASLQPAFPAIRLSALHLDAPSLGGLTFDFRLVVNATPAGMHPRVDVSPWPPGAPFPRAAFFYDLVYNPPETAWLAAIRLAGLPGCNGLGMLVEQAALSFAAWTGFDPPRAPLFAAVSGSYGNSF